MPKAILAMGDSNETESKDSFGGMSIQSKVGVEGGFIKQ